MQVLVMEMHLVNKYYQFVWDNGSGERTMKRSRGTQPFFQWVNQPNQSGILVGSVLNLIGST